MRTSTYAHEEPRHTEIDAPSRACEDCHGAKPDVNFYLDALSHIRYLCSACRTTDRYFFAKRAPRDDAD